MSYPPKGPKADCPSLPSLLKTCHSCPLACPSEGYLMKACSEATEGLCCSLWDGTLGCQANGGEGWWRGECSAASWQKF